MTLKKLMEYLDSNKVKYITLVHSQAFTAQEIAAVAHVSGKELAKTVMITVDGTMTMAVVPASDMVDFRLVKQAAGASTVELATEQEFKGLFPDCEIGAMPPFGNLYGISVLASQRLTEDEKIAFNAGTHRELVQLAYADYARLVKPQVLNISTPKRSPQDHDWHPEM
jgi:Ala-tRNA(Pro) deacylase